MSGHAVRWVAPELGAPSPRDVAEEALAPEPMLRPPSLDEIQAIEEAARREGLERGHAEGLSQGQAEMRRLAAQIEGILDNFSRPLARLENEVLGALGDLAVRIAGSLIGPAYQADPTLLQALVSEALDAVGGVQRNVEVRLHPDDITALTPLLAATAEGPRLVPDLTLSRGDLRVHAEAVRIDGTVDARLRAALETIMRKSGVGA
jgi:flagellar assembly protein FliH